jgi:hypothetical protein
MECLITFAFCKRKVNFQTQNVNQTVAISIMVIGEEEQSCWGCNRELPLS